MVDSWDQGLVHIAKDDERNRIKNTGHCHIIIGERRLDPFLKLLMRLIRSVWPEWKDKNCYDQKYADQERGETGESEGAKRPW